MKQILIIDDEPQIRSLLTKMLKREGFNVIVASDGKEGMRLFNKEPADLVITDIIMPEKEGIEIIQELRKDHPTLPIIAISGGGRNSSDSYLKIAKIFGANEIFEKPVEKQKLINAIKTALHN
ncbi:MAG: response regulator [Bacteroidales bacterium]|nr:response regulator [Bacteroidales bacterium]